MSQLVSMNEGQDSDMSTYAQNAKNQDRVKEVLKQPCCKAKCKRKLRFNMVWKVIMFFWALPKGSQDCVLWAIQQRAVPTTSEDSEGSESDSDNASDSDKKSKISWKIEGGSTHCFIVAVIVSSANLIFFDSFASPFCFTSENAYL